MSIIIKQPHYLPFKKLELLGPKWQPADVVRYHPLEFNGWTQRHWTKPFEGERFSLVWFTPAGTSVFRRRLVF